ncbi:MAG: phosphatase PAP2 family protein [Betaproteobacteria bacterium]
MNKLRFNNCIILCVVFLYCTFSALAQAEQASTPADVPAQEVQPEKDASSEAPVEFNKDYFKAYVTDFKSIITSPGRWDSSDWITASIVTGISVGLFTQDDKIQTWVQKHKNRTTSHLSDDAKQIGAYSVPAVIGLGLYGYAASDAKAKKTFLLSAESFIVTGAFVQVLKRSTGRHRPFTGDSHDTWSVPSISGNNDHHSFPSGDASSAFAIASVVASEYNNVIVPPLVYTASTLIALVRVHNNGHWSSDVFVGSAIGYFTGKAIVASHRGSGESRLSLAPMMTGDSMGMCLAYKF